jgi:hypothetical protein
MYKNQHRLSALFRLPTAYLYRYCVTYILFIYNLCTLFSQTSSYLYITQTGSYLSCYLEYTRGKTFVQVAYPYRICVKSYIVVFERDLVVVGIFTVISTVNRWPSHYHRCRIIVWYCQSKTLESIKSRECSCKVDLTAISSDPIRGDDDVCTGGEVHQFFPITMML